MIRPERSLLEREQGFDVSRLGSPQTQRAIPKA